MTRQRYIVPFLLACLFGTASHCYGHNIPPVAILEEDFQYGCPGVAVSFDGRGSYDPDIGGSIILYEWDWGDGSPIYQETIGNPTHIFSTADTYTVRFRVKDAHPSFSTWTQTEVEVVDVTQATFPDPGPGETNISLNAWLNWTAGTGVGSQEVYFGTVNPPTSSEFKGDQIATSFDPGPLDLSTTYYWRIDARDGAGPVWWPKVDGALDFDGVDDYVEIDSPAYKGITGTASRTVAAWIKTSATSGSKNIVTWGSNFTGQIWVFTVLNSKLTLSVKDGLIVGTTNIADGQWHHVAAVFDRTISLDVKDVKLYVDGELDSISSVTAQPINTASGDNVKIGTFGGGTLFNGLIDEVRIYDTDVSRTDIKVLARIRGGVPRDQNLVAHWTMYEGAGSSLDDISSGDHDGTINGAQWNTTKGAAGKVGGALRFDGVDDYLEATGYQGITGTASRTVAAWIRTSQTSGALNILGWGQSVTAKAWSLNVLNSKLALSVQGGITIGQIDIADGAWHHIAAVLEDDGSANVNEILLYVDGVLDTPISPSDLLIDTLAGFNVQIGKFGSSSPNTFNGLIDDVRIYNTNLSATDILDLKNGTEPMTNPVAHWTLDGHSRDSSVNEYHGTLYGGYSCLSTGDVWEFKTPYLYFVDGDVPGGALNGSSWLDAFADLQSAIDAAVYGYEIWVKAGTYTPTPPSGSRSDTFVLKDGVDVYGGFAGTETSREDRNWKDNQTILSGDLQGDDVAFASGIDNSYHVVTGANNVVLDGFTIRGGLADVNSTYGGAGILNDNVSPTIRNCTFMYNYTRDGKLGGAIHNRGGASPTFINCLIAGNFTQGNSAGGIYQDGGTLSLVNCTIANNVGDGIQLANTASATLNNCILWQNRGKTDDPTYYPKREIVFLAGANTLNVNYSNIEGGQTSIVGTGTINWGVGNIDIDPQFLTWGQWEWKLNDGTTLVDSSEGTPTTFTEDLLDLSVAGKVIIYDLKKNASNFEQGIGDDFNDEFVEDTLDPNKVPRWDSNASNNHTNTVSNKTAFDLWFNAKSTNKGPVHNNYVVTWECTDSDDGIFRLNSEHFFPIDDCCPYACGSENTCGDDYSCFGKLCVDDVKSSDGHEHNWHFTLQYHTKMTYVPGESLYFEASDDLFIFIDDQIVIERGGYYVTQASKTAIKFDGNGDVTVYYDPDDPKNPTTGSLIKVFSLGLQPHAEYDFDLFFAQRRSPLSILKVERGLSTTDEMIAAYIPGDYRLLPGSPCIDAADNVAVPAGVVFDLDVAARFIDDSETADTGNGTSPIVDMGAYEYPAPTSVVLDIIVDPEPVAGAILETTGYVVLDGTGSPAASPNTFDVTVRLNGNPLTDAQVDLVWNLQSGLADGFTFNSPYLIEPIITFTKVSSYQFEITASHAPTGLVTPKIVIFNITESIIQEIYAGAAKVVNLDTSGQASVFMDDAYIKGISDQITWDDTSYTYVQPTIMNVNAVNTEIQFNYVGTYTFTLTRDADGASDSVVVQVRQAATGQDGPRVRAEIVGGAECDSGNPSTKCKTLDLSTVSTVNVDLTAYLSDDGLPFGILSAEWLLIGGDGPADGVLITDPTSTDLGSPENPFTNGGPFNDQEFTRTATFTKPGTYLFQIQVTDEELTVSEQVEVRVSGLLIEIGFRANTPDIIIWPARQAFLTADVYHFHYVGSVWNKDDVTGPTALTWQQPSIRPDSKDVYYSTDHDGVLANNNETTVVFGRYGHYVLALEGTYDNAGTDITATGTFGLDILQKPISASLFNSLYIDEDQIPWICGGNSADWGDSINYSYLGNGLVRDNGTVNRSIEDSFIRISVDPSFLAPTESDRMLNNILVAWHGDNHAMALDTDNNIWTWGDNTTAIDGTGLSSPISIYEPVKIDPSVVSPMDPQKIVSIYATSTLFDNSDTPDLSSLAVQDLNQPYTYVGNGIDYHGVVWSWGYVALFNNSPPDYVRSGAQDAGVETPLQYIVSVASESEHDLMALEIYDPGQATKMYGRVFRWNVPSGVPGPQVVDKIIYDSEAGQQSELQEIIAIDGANTVSIALDVNGRVFTWGKADFLSATESGLGGKDFGGVRIYSSTDAVEVWKEDGSSKLDNIVAVAAGGHLFFHFYRTHFMALDRDGYVWTWGSNDYGQLGHNNVTDFPWAKRVFAPDRDNDGIPDDLNNNGDFTDDYLSNIVAISAGGGHCLAMDRDGVVWSWGSNASGQLGAGIPQDYFESSYTTAGKRYPRRTLPVMTVTDNKKIHNLDNDRWYIGIQLAIDDAASEHEIVVHPGRYFESVVIDSKDITLRSLDPTDFNIVSSTIIDGFYNKTPYRVINTLNTTSTISGFTITNGNHGIYNNSSADSLTITNNHIVGNIFGITSRTLDVIRNNWIWNNSNSIAGSPAIIEHNTLVRNVTGISGSKTAEHCIIWGNETNVQQNFQQTFPILNYCAVEDGYTGPGIGIIDINDSNPPAFANIYEFSDTTSGSQILFPPFDTIEVANGSKYTAGEIIEIGDDGIPRQVVSISADKIVFAPLLEQRIPNGIVVYNWGAPGGIPLADFDVDVDLHLTTESKPLIDKGEPDFISNGTDIDGEPRVMGQEVDIGADEFPPFAVNAGPSITLYLNQPDSSISETLTDAIIYVNDLDFGVSSLRYEWAVPSKPTGAGVIFTGSNSTKLRPLANFDKIGTYVLKLQVFESAETIPIGQDTLTVNVRLSVNAGNDQALVWEGPTATQTTLAGSMDFVPGTAPYDNYHTQWVYEGQGTVDTGSDEWLDFTPDITIQDVLNPQVQFKMQPGIYPFTLQVLDPTGSVVGSDMVVVRVNAQQIWVDAGSNQVIILATGTGSVKTTLAGSVWGTAGIICEWIYEGDGDVAFSNSAKLDSEVTFIKPGQYFLTLLARQADGVIVNSDVVTIQVVDSGVFADAGTYLPIAVNKTLNLKGTIYNDKSALSAGTDPGLSGLNGAWLSFMGIEYQHEWVFTGPSTVTFGDPFSLGTWARFQAIGKYTLTLVIKDINGNTIGADSTTIIVGGSSIEQATIWVDADKIDSDNIVSITFNLANGNATYDITGEIFGDLSGVFSTQWLYVKTDVSPGNVTIVPVSASAPGEVKADLTFDRPGTYQISLIAKDAAGNVLAGDSATIIVTHTNNYTVDAGDDDTISLLLTAVKTLVGVISDPSGPVVGIPTTNHKVEWKVIGPQNLVHFTTPEALTTTVTFDRPGKYALQLLLKDKADNTLHTDTVVITVTLAPFMANAGEDQTGNLSSGTLSLTLTGTILGDFDPSTGTVEWQNDPENLPLSGFVTDYSDMLHPQVTITFSAAGIYEFTLEADDGGGNTHQDNVSVFVFDEGFTESIFVKAGSDKIVTLPGTLTLDQAIIIDPIGQATPEWSATGGAVTFTPSSDVLQPTVSFDGGAGTYTLKLTAQDASESPPFDEMTVIVRPDPTVDNDDPVIAIVETIPSPIPVPPNPLNVDLTVTIVASDENLDYVDLILFDENNLSGSIVSPDSVEVTGGTPDHPTELTITHTFLISTIVNGTYKVKAIAYDKAGKSSQTATSVFDRTIGFASFALTINPTNSDDSITLYNTSSTLEVNATFEPPPQPGTVPWKIYVYPKGTPLVEPPTDSGNSESVSVSFDPMVPPADGWANGEYELVLTRTDTLDEIIGYFTVAITPSGPIAQITNPAKAVVFDQLNILQSETMSLPYVTDGLLDLEGKATHSALSHLVEYKVTVDGINLTPGPRNSEGYRKKAVEGVVNDNDLGPIDLTTLPNGPHTLTLNVRVPDDPGTYQTATDSVKFNLDTPLKVGNVKFSQEDLVIPVGGIPISVIRSYDSFQRDRQGDFGYGWNYSLANLDIDLHEKRSGSGTNNSITRRVGGDFDRDVTLTLPDGRRATFAFSLQVTNKFDQPGFTSFPTDWKVQYKAPKGVNYSLRTKGFMGLHYDLESLFGQDIGGVGYFWEDEFDAYIPTGNSKVNLSYQDFSGYILTDELSGVEYHIERKSYNRQTIDQTNGSYEYRAYGKPYISRIDMPTGEYLLFLVNEDDGENPIVTDVQHFDADGLQTQAIAIERDTAGRIEEIRAPSESSSDPATLRYSYDDYGNLITVDKLVQKDAPVTYETITFEYDGARQHPADHYVTNIRDARGLAPIRYVYDDAGRLVATIDARGNRIELKHDTVNKMEEVTDRAGNVTQYFYNDRGNVTQVVPLGTDSTFDGLTAYEYNENSSSPDSPVKVAVALNVSANPNNLDSSDWSTTLTEYDDMGRPTKVTDPEDNITEMTYDTRGNVLTTTQKRPGEIVVSTTANTYQRDANGESTGLLLQSLVKDENNNVVEQTSYTYTLENHLQTVTRHDLQGGSNAVTTYTYDQASSNSYDQPFSIQDATGKFTYFKYDDNGNQIKSWYKWEDPTDGDAVVDKTVYTFPFYDNQNRQIATAQQIEDGDTDHTLTYDDTKAVTLGQTYFNMIGQVDYSYDENGIVTKQEYDELGNVVETLVYDSLANFQTYYPSYPADTTGILTISRTLYDTEGRGLVTVGPYDPADTTTNPVGIENVYDELGRVIETRRWANVEIQLEDLAGSDGTKVGLKVPNTVTPANAWDGSAPAPTIIGWTVDNDGDGTGGELPTLGNELSYSRNEYDFTGRLIRTFTLDEDGNEQPTSYLYDIAGKQTDVIDPAGHTWNAGTSDWDIDLTKGRRTKTEYEGTRRKYAYDARAYTDTDPGAGTYAFTDETGTYYYNYRTEFAYDTLGRTVMTTHPPTVVVEGGAVPVVTYTHVGHDGLGRKEWQSESTTESNPGLLGDPDGIRWFEYDSAGRLKNVKLPRATNPHDGLDEYVENIYDYDIFGNLISIIDPDGKETTFTYNHLHRQTSHRLPDGLTENKGYDNLGRLIKQTDFNGQVVGYEYAFGLLHYKRYYTDETAYQANTPTDIYEFLYDNLDRRDQVMINGLLTQDYEYDAEGRVIWIWTPQGTIGYEYDTKTGRRKAVIITDGIGSANIDTRISFTYDEVGRLKTVTVEKRNTISVAEVTTYNYNAAGSLESINYPNGNSATYIYDALNRLIDLTHKDSLNAPINGYAYDLYADGQRAKVTELDTTVIDWTYDDLNHLTQETYDAIGTVDDYLHTYEYELSSNRYSFDDGSTKRYYHYDTNDHLLKETSDVAGANILIQYGYDNNGAQTSKTVGASLTNYVYNLQQRLTEVNDGVSVISQYQYNPDGMRVQKIIGGITTNYLIDPQNHTGYAQVFKEIQTGANDLTYIIGNDVIAQVTGAANPQYFEYDGHGSVRRLIGSDGASLEDYHYDAYGNMIGSPPSPQTNLRYTGEMFDTNLSWYYNRARWYNPANGRFNRTDPFAGNNADPQSFHKYLYAHANPINNIDPSGLIATLTELNVTTLIVASLQAMTTTYFAFFAADDAVILTLKNRTSPSAYDYIVARKAQPRAKKAIKTAVKLAQENGHTRKTKSEIKDLPIFFVFQTRTPDIYKHDRDVQLKNSKWLSLQYRGAGNTELIKKIRESAITYAKIHQGYDESQGSPDEYPFASTFQGGPGASVRGVPLWEQTQQGADLSGFYNSRLKNQSKWFLVIPLGI